MKTDLQGLIVSCQSARTVVITTVIIIIIGKCLISPALIFVELYLSLQGVPFFEDACVLLIWENVAK